MHDAKWPIHGEPVEPKKKPAKTTPVHKVAIKKPIKPAMAPTPESKKGDGEVKEWP
jgi:hypothetical protein